MKNLRKLRKAKGLTQKQLGDLVGVSESFVSQMESGKKLPSFEVALKLGEVLECESTDFFSQKEKSPTLTDSFVTFTVLGEVAAGYDKYAMPDWTDGEIDIPVTWLSGRTQEDYFVLRVTGNSMFPTYQDGDIVLVLRSDTMDHSGQIGVVMYDDDKATLKRVEYVAGEDWMKLIPINPQYPPIMVTDERLEHCRVLGIPKMLVRKVD